jgi:hypothetical protein
MNANQIEDALRGDPKIRPSAEFASRVMGAVRREAQGRQGIEFPWRRMLPGMVACCLLTVVALVLIEPQPLSEATAMKLRDPKLMQAVTWVPTYVLGTWVMIWTALRVAGFRR